MAAVLVPVLIGATQTPEHDDLDGVSLAWLDLHRVARFGLRDHPVRRCRNDLVSAKGVPHFGEGCDDAAVTARRQLEISVEGAVIVSRATSFNTAGSGADVLVARAILAQDELRQVPAPLACERTERVRLGSGDRHVVRGLAVLAVVVGVPQGLAHAGDREHGHHRCQEHGGRTEVLEQEVLVEALVDQVAHVHGAEYADAVALLGDRLDHLGRVAGLGCVDLGDQGDQRFDDRLHGVHAERALGDVGVDRRLVVVLQRDLVGHAVARHQELLAHGPQQVDELQPNGVVVEPGEVVGLHLQRILAVVDDADDPLVLLHAEAPVDGALGA